jgi:type VI secretion system secreted protein VgrG
MTNLLGTTEHVTLAIDGTPIEVVSLDGKEAISWAFSYRLVCSSAAGMKGPDELLGFDARITLDDGMGVTRTITGLVTEAEAGFFDDGHRILTLTVRPKTFPLELGREGRTYHEIDVVGIAKIILGKCGIPTRFELVRTYQTRPYVAQYREDDWTFLERLLDEEGIYYWFDHEGDETTIVLSDDSTLASDLVGGAVVPFAHESGLNVGGEVIEEFAEEAEVMPNRFTVASFNAQKPLLRVMGNAGQGPLEVYTARGGGPETPESCARRAKIMAEAAAAARNTVAGLSTSVRLVPGMILEITDHPLSGFDGRYLIAEATIAVVQRRRGSTGGKGADRPYRCNFRGVPQSSPFRSPLDIPKARQPGLQSGIVVGMVGEEVSPHATGEVRVKLYWDRSEGQDEKSGKWMRVAQRNTNDSMLLPRIGWTVLTFNEEGVLDAPSVLSRIHDGEHLPSYPLPANKTRVVWKTATTPGGGSFNEIRFEDQDGAEEMFINASRDMSVLALDAKRETVLRDSRRFVGVNHLHAIAVDYTEAVGRNQTVAILGSEKVSTGPRRKTVIANESITIGGKRSLKVGQAESLAVAKNRTLKVGAAMIDMTLGQITAQARKRRSILVGGVMMKVSGKSISEDVGKVAVQLVGGAKLELAKKARALEVAKVYTEMVGAAILLDTDASYTDHADLTSKWKVGAKAGASAPELLVEASEKIEIKCGTSILTILPDSIEIKTDALDLSEAESLDAVSQVIDHNC